MKFQLPHCVRGLHCLDTVEFCPGRGSWQPAAWSARRSPKLSARPCSGSVRGLLVPSVQPPCPVSIILRILSVAKGASAPVGGWSLCQDPEEANRTRDLDLINRVLEPREPARLVSLDFGLSLLIYGHGSLLLPGKGGRRESQMERKGPRSLTASFALPKSWALIVSWPLGSADGDLASRQTDTD